MDDSYALIGSTQLLSKVFLKYRKFRLCPRYKKPEFLYSIYIFTSQINYTLPNKICFAPSTPLTSDNLRHNFKYKRENLLQDHRVNFTYFCTGKKTVMMSGIEDHKVQTTLSTQQVNSD